MRNCRTTEEPGRGAGFGRLVGPGRGTGGRRHNPAPNKFRMQFPHDTNRRTLKNRRISTIRFQHLKYTQENCMRNCRTTDGPGRGARGWRQGLAGHRADAPSEARVWRSRGRAAAHGHTKQPGPTGSPAQREGRRPRAHQAPLVWRVPEGPEGTGGLRGAAPNEVRMPSLAGGRDLRRPEHPWGRNTTGTNNVTRPRPVSRPRPRHSVSADQKDGTARIGTALIKATAPPAIRRSCPRDPRPRRGRPRGGRRGRGTGSRTRSPGPRHGRSGSTAGRHRARHTRRA